MEKQKIIRIVYLLGEIDAGFSKFKNFADQAIMNDNSLWLAESCKQAEILLDLLATWEDHAK